MIELEKAYGLPPHSDPKPFELGDIVTLRNFPLDREIPIERSHPGGLVLETRDYRGSDTEPFYQQIRIADFGWTASYWWRVK